MGKPATRASTRTAKEQAEQYRIMLGLRTWEEQAQLAEERRESLRGVMSDEAYVQYKGRQSGRTTKGLLLALALADRSPEKRLVVEGRSELHERVLLARARQLAHDLRLDIRIIGYRDSDSVHYNDHED